MNVRPVTKHLKPGTIIAVLVGALVVVPIYIAFLNSFKESGEIAGRPFSYTGFTIENYLAIFRSGNIRIVRMYWNSLRLTAVSLVLIAIFCPMAAYYVGRNDDRMVGKALFFYLIIGLMAPAELTLVPLARMYIDLNLIGRAPGMYLLYFGSLTPFTIMLYAKFVQTVPVELEESAEMDGAKRFRIFWQIVYPLLKPCTGTVLIFNGVFIWNDFINPLILLQGPRAETITLGIFSAIGAYTVEWGRVFGYVVLASLPLLILFLALQRFFIKSMVEGAIKG